MESSLSRWWPSEQSEVAPSWGSEVESSPTPTHVTFPTTSSTPLSNVFTLSSHLLQQLLTNTSALWSSSILPATSGGSGTPYHVSTLASLLSPTPVVVSSSSSSPSAAPSRSAIDANASPREITSSDGIDYDGSPSPIEHASFTAENSAGFYESSRAVVTSLVDGIVGPPHSRHTSTSREIVIATPTATTTIDGNATWRQLWSFSTSGDSEVSSAPLYPSFVYSSPASNEQQSLSTPRLTSATGGGNYSYYDEEDLSSSASSWWNWESSVSSSWLIDWIASINVTGDDYDPWDERGGSGGFAGVNASATPTTFLDLANLTMAGGVNCVTRLYDNGSSGVLCWSPDGTDTSTPAAAATTLGGPEEAPPGKQYWALVLLLFPLFTVFGNVLVILSVYKERNLHTVTNYFIVSLAVADLLVAALVMPFAVYFLVNVSWELSPFLCDFYIAMDVACSTSSIFNLVAISIDRFIAVTQPIKYAKHKNSNRVVLTIAIVWVVSAAIGSPIVLGLNTSPERNNNLCMFYNPDFIIYSSLSSFYIPCIIMVFLYYRIFRVIHERALKTAAAKRIANTHANNSASGGGGAGVGGGVKRPPPPSPADTVITNVAHARLLPSGGGGGSSGARGVGALRTLFRYKETVTLCVSLEPDQPTANTESGSQDMDEDEELGANGNNGAALMDVGDVHAARSPAAPAATGTEFALAPLLTDGSSSTGPATCSSTLSSSGQISSSMPKSSSGQRDLLLLEPNGNHDSGYGASSHVTELLETTFLNQVVVEGSGGGHPLTPPIHPPPPASPRRLERRRSGGGAGGSARKGSRRNGAPAGSAGLNSGGGLNAGTPCGGDAASERSWTLSMHGSERGGTVGDGSLSPGGRRKKPRFHLARTHKSSRKKREKSAAKKERKATKTLAIVLGVFLACWVPFFTCNIFDAICIKLNEMDMQPGVTAFLLTTWLGYMNSFINPVIYTIFNPEFRKAFKKILFGN